MSAAVSVPAPTSTQIYNPRPSFVGIVRGELFKVSRQVSTWILAVLLLGAICLPYLVELASSFGESIRDNPTWAIYKTLGTDMLVLKVFGGAFVIIVTARLIGMEYSGGTIRVLLGRGVGRLQLLFGKLTALTIIALGMVIVTLALDLLLAAILSLIAAGSMDLFKPATSAFWSDAGTYLLLALLSLGVTILMATAVTVVGRSLIIGLSVGMLWYPAENFSIIFLVLGYQLASSDFWRLLSGNFLGLNLNAMPAIILPQRASPATNFSFSTPLVPVDGGHTLLITALFAVVFAVVAIVLTARRDVKE
ncbi:MAG TPA: ABC transporter permease [Ktedonobacterales bacterium]|nr:ABC transporter permease [Ktedonobacterales bacterium]